MTKEQKMEYTRRISNANQTSLLVILYDICLTHMENAEKAEDYEELKSSVRSARESVRLLRDTLNFDYDPAGHLAALYRFMDEQLALVIIRKDISGIGRVRKIMGNLRSAYAELAGTDTSQALMQNTEQVYAGLTYGKNSGYETVVNAGGSNRGYLA